LVEDKVFIFPIAGTGAFHPVGGLPSGKDPVSISEPSIPFVVAVGGGVVGDIGDIVGSHWLAWMFHPGFCSNNVQVTAPLLLMASLVSVVLRFSPLSVSGLGGLASGGHPSGALGSGFGVLLSCR